MLYHRGLYIQLFIWLDDLVLIKFALQKYLVVVEHLAFLELGHDFGLGRGLVSKLLLILEVDFANFLHLNYVLGHSYERLIDETLKLRFICCGFYLNFLHVESLYIE